MSLGYVLVFAGNGFQADYYRKMNQYRESQVRYVRDLTVLRDLDVQEPPLRMPAVGSFWQREDCDELVAYAAQKGIEISYAHHPNIHDPRDHRAKDYYL